MLEGFHNGGKPSHRPGAKIIPIGKPTGNHHGLTALKGGGLMPDELRLLFEGIG